MNTTNIRLNLKQGYVSSTLLKAAGHRLQTEVSKNQHNLRYGDIVTTRGYELKCQYVFHGACKKWTEHGSDTVGTKYSSAKRKENTSTRNILVT